MEKIREWFDNIEKCKEAIERIYRLKSKDKMVVSALLKNSCDIVDAYVEDIPEDIYEMFYEEVEGIIRDLIGNKIKDVEMYMETFDMGIVEAFYYYCRPEKVAHWILDDMD